jgi:NADH-quinone oxidoreductase subunit J
MTGWFGLLAAVLIASAIFTITARKPVYSVVGLLVNFIALAIAYLTLQAEFLAVIQIVVYSGAILILFVFVIALLSSGVRPFEIGPDRMSRATLPIAILFGVVSVAAIAVSAARVPVHVGPPTGVTGQGAAFGSVVDFGAALFTRNLLPFEVTAFILMVSIVGVVLIAGDEPLPRKRRRRGSIEREPILKTDGATRPGQGAIR